MIGCKVLKTMKRFQAQPLWQPNMIMRNAKIRATTMTLLKLFYFYGTHVSLMRSPEPGLSQIALLLFLKVPTEKMYLSPWSAQITLHLHDNSSSVAVHFGKRSHVEWLNMRTKSVPCKGSWKILFYESSWKFLWISSWKIQFYESMNIIVNKFVLFTTAVLHIDAPWRYPIHS